MYQLIEDASFSHITSYMDLAPEIDTNRDEERAANSFHISNVDS